MAPSPAIPTCPRCTYDLSGQVTTWTDSCPTTGTCSECGLTFEWRLIFNPHLDGLPWFIESSKPPRLRGAWLRTAMRVLTPWRFWRDVRVEVPIRWRGVLTWLTYLMLWTTLAPVIGWALFSALGSVYRSVTRGTFDLLHALRYGLVSGLKDVGVNLAERATWTDFPTWTLVATAATVAFPMVFLMLPSTRRASKVRAALVWRATAYAVAWPVPFAVWSVLSLACMAITDQFGMRFRGWPGPRPTNVFLESLDLIAGHSPLAWESQGGWNRDNAPHWLSLPVLVWISCFWLFAMKRSWRMPDWRAAWVACASVAFVLSLFALLTDGSLLARWL